MCDEHTELDNEEFFSKGGGELSRRGAFGVISAATLAACTTSPENAKAVAEQDVKITTPDGTCDAYFVHPASGKHAAVLIWPDIMGLRPAFRMMGKRLAESGYSVLVVNPFYRQQVSPVIQPGESFSDPPTRTRLVGLMQKLTADTHKTDAIAFTGWLDKQSAVDTKKKMATTGYCMGGPIVFRTAAAVSNRVGAACSFHGGGLVTAQPNSPHLLIPTMKASFLVAVAQNDDQQQPDAKNVLRKSFDDAKLPAEIEVYPAQHGWCPPDAQVYDNAQAEKAWSRQLELFSKTLA